MASPGYAALGAGTASNATSFNPTLSSTSLPVGSMVIVFVGADGNPTLSTSSSGWSKLGQWTTTLTTGATVAAFVFEVVTENTVGALTVGSSASEHMCALQLKVAPGTAGNTVAVLTPPAASTGNGSSSGDPPSATQNSGSTQDMLWVPLVVQATNSDVTTAPSGYSALAVNTSAGTHNNAAAIAIAGKQVSSVANGATEDPAAFTLGNGTGYWAATTLGFYDVSGGGSPVTFSFGTIF